jgi:hypothetical protein
MSQGGPGDALHHPGQDQHRGRGRERGDHGAEQEPGVPQEQQPTPPDPVPDRSRDDREHPDDEAVGVDDPQLLDRADPQVGGERGQGQEQHVDVDGGQGGRQEQQRQAEPGTRGRTGARPRYE